MPYNVVFEDAQEYIKCKVAGEWTPGSETKDSLTVWSRVAKECLEKKIPRVLSVWDVPGHLPILSAYKIAVYPGLRGWPNHFKLAVVHLHEERLKDSLFAETVAVNHGYQVKIFRDERAALAWLLHPSSSVG